MESNRNRQRQTAYQVLVAPEKAALERASGYCWDSGEVRSDQSVGVPYTGKALASGQRYWWKVRVWDQDQHAVWSETATFLTGKLCTEDWRGRWIGAPKFTAASVTGALGFAVEAPKADEATAELIRFPHAPILLRKSFNVTKPVKRATAFFCGLGWSELVIDGRRVGEYVMGPGPTTYDKRVQYLTFDVTNHFGQPGPKTLDVTLYDGWYALERDPWVHRFHTRPYVDRPKLLLDLRLEHHDGSETVVTSDSTWKWSLGPIRRAWICEQDTDFRVTPGPWRPVALLAGPAGRLVAQREPPTRIVETIQPASLCEANGAWTYTFDREFTGFVRFRASGPSGTAVKLATFPAKLKGRNSSFILSGKERDEFAPQETYTAIKRVTVQGLTLPPALADLTGCRITGVGEPVSSFACSDETINWLHECARRTQANYVTFLPNDPTREFKAWTEDIQNMFWSAMYLFDSQAMYERWQYDMLDAQTPDGNLPNVAPGPVFDAYNSPWWGGCSVWLPWELWLRAGDDRLLCESYEGMKRYVDFLARKANDGAQDWGLGDWLAVQAPPRSIVNTPAAFYYATIVSRTAEMLGRKKDAEKYRVMARDIRDRFNARFLDRATGIYGGHCTQAGQALPLALGMVPDEIRPLAQQALLVNIAKRKNHVSSGFVGTPYLLAVLADFAPGVGHTMTTQRDYPSWYSMTKGAGCDQMMETWAGGQAFMPSLGGNIAAWNLAALAGIRPDSAGPGFKKILIQPAIVGNLTWVKAHFDSPYGRIVSHWRRKDDRLTMKVTIPCNTTATIKLPDFAGITVNGEPREKSEFGLMAGRWEIEATRTKGQQ